MKIDKITVGPFMTNTYIITNEGKSIIIDPTIDLDKKLDIDKYNIVAILLTHGHIDHIKCVNMFDVPIYIHSDEAEFLSNNTLNLSNAFNIPFTYKRHEVIKVEDCEELKLIGLNIKVLHTPGHTTGSICFLIDNSLFTGDTLFQVGEGRTDFYKGSQADMDCSISALLDDNTPNYDVYPGHGESTTIEFERKYNPYRK